MVDLNQLRVQFAMAALQGEMASQSDGYDWSKQNFPRLAERCFDIADTMIEHMQKDIAAGAL